MNAQAIRALSITATLSLTLAASAASGDWPCWRGAKRDGVSTETGLLKTWPQGGPQLLWKATGCGVGYSSVSVVTGRVFTMGDGPDASGVHCFDEKNGKKLWTSGAIGKPGGNYAGTRCTPTVDGDSVYALAQFGDLVCLDMATGKERWRKNLQRDFGGNYSGWNYAESPLVDGDKVVVTPGGARGAIAALDKKTGAPIWQSADFKDGAQYSSLVPADIYNVHQYIQLTAQSVAGVDAKTGKLLWRAPRAGSTAVIPTPVVFNNLVYVTSGYNAGCNTFAVTMDTGGFKAAELWSNKEMVNHHGGVILVNGYLYGYSETRGWICQEFKTGKVMWSNKGVGKGSIAYADGMLYCRSEGGSGAIALIEATPSGYFERGRFDQPGRSKQNSWAHPVIAGGKLFIRDQDVLLCYDVKKK
ncbi:MAG: PQQ-like beta-propeller repeat protein [Verrucomicrobia bacterium]|nr:PQQ-like beta-propeller repeat protein [Verrucomicrobiota bacterium]